VFQRWWAHQSANRKVRLKISAAALAVLSILMLALGYWITVLEVWLAVALMVVVGESLMARERCRSGEPPPDAAP
jgi:uncharacterized membrane protein